MYFPYLSFAAFGREDGQPTPSGGVFVWKRVLSQIDNKFSRILCSSKVDCLFHEIPPLVSTLSHKIPIHSFPLILRF